MILNSLARHQLPEEEGGGGGGRDRDTDRGRDRDALTIACDVVCMCRYEVHVCVRLPVSQ